MDRIGAAAGRALAAEVAAAYGAAEASPKATFASVVGHGRDLPMPRSQGNRKHSSISKGWIT
jgi:hypothetical protein